MTDTTTDMTGFLERYDQRQRLLFTAALSAALVLSAVIVTHVLMTGEAGPKPVAGAVWLLGVVFPPLFVVGWWSYAEHLVRARRKTAAPDGRFPTSAHDAHNGVRIANAGFVFNIGVMASVIAQQAVMALMAFGRPTGDLVPRATCVAVGVVTIYLGNLWPRMPMPRPPGRTTATRMKSNRMGGWVMVIGGVLVVLLGLFMPLLYPHR